MVIRRAFHRGGVTLSWGNNLCPPVDSAPVGRGTGQRDAGRSNRGCVASKQAQTRRSSPIDSLFWLPIWTSAGKRIVCSVDASEVGPIPPCGFGAARYTLLRATEVGVACKCKWGLRGR